MSIINTMQKDPRRGYIKGVCAHCKQPVWEELWLLDDAYNVWIGKCPHCDARNLLGMTGLRGYSSAGMDLVLPTDEEVAANDWPKDWPTQGSKGPATCHGSNVGELLHKIREES